MKPNEGGLGGDKDDSHGPRDILYGPRRSEELAKKHHQPSTTILMFPKLR